VLLESFGMRGETSSRSLEPRRQLMHGLHHTPLAVFDSGHDVDRSAGARNVCTLVYIASTGVRSGGGVPTIARVEEDLSREAIVLHLQSGLEREPAVLAMWLEGSSATGQADALSDIDLVVDVEDGSLDLVFQRAETLLAELGSLATRLELEIDHQLLRHRLYRLERTSEFWTIDFVARAHIRQFVFDREDAGSVRVLFDRASVIRFRDGPWRSDQLDERLARLQETYWSLRPWVVKQIRRGKFLEAFGYYERYVLRPLVEALRIAHAPRKSDYYVKDIYRDLPPDITRALEGLYQVSDISAFEARLEVADGLFRAVIDRPSAHESDDSS
jgi:predicted nucleotidyltransferase